MREFDGMKEEELRTELRKIREERSGKGRERKKVAREKRMVTVMKDTKRKLDVEKVENAEWI